jgi:IMP dehydrogenase/GMP reductase
VTRDVPTVSAAMDTITEVETAAALGEFGTTVIADG